MLMRLATVAVIAGLSLGTVACEEIRSGPAGGFETMAAIPSEGRIVTVTQGQGDLHGVWIEAADGTLSVVWVNPTTREILAKSQSFPRK